MAVADVFTAITEDRPYSKGMQRSQAARTLEQMVKANALDGDVVSTLMLDFDDFNAARIAAARPRPDNTSSWWGHNNVNTEFIDS